MADVVSKTILILCSDRAMQEALRRIVEAAGCHPLLAGTIDLAKSKRVEQSPVLMLVDPLLVAECTAAFSTDAGVPIVPVPVRTSSTGVRRIAKRNDAAVRWLSSLVNERCAVAAS